MAVGPTFVDYRGIHHKENTLFQAILTIISSVESQKGAIAVQSLWQ